MDKQQRIAELEQEIEDLIERAEYAERALALALNRNGADYRKMLLEDKDIQGLVLHIDGAGGYFPIEYIKEAIERDAKRNEDGAVVLTQEEYKVLKIKKKEKHWLETCMSVWKNAKIDARKETAREFFDLSEQCGGGVAFWKRARALAKRYGVEVK